MFVRANIFHNILPGPDEELKDNLINFDEEVAGKIEGFSKPELVQNAVVPAPQRWNHSPRCPRGRVPAPVPPPAFEQRKQNVLKEPSRRSSSSRRLCPTSTSSGISRT